MYVKSDTLFLADVSENFRNMCLKIYELEPTKSLSVPGLVQQTALKENKVKLDLSTHIDVLLIAEKGIRGGICHSSYRYAKANKKYLKDLDKNKNLSYIQYWYANDLHEWALSQKLPVNNFELTKDTSQLNEYFIKKTIMNTVIKDIFSKLIFNISKNYMNFIMICYFYQTE